MARSDMERLDPRPVLIMAIIIILIVAILVTPLFFRYEEPGGFHTAPKLILSCNTRNETIVYVHSALGDHLYRNISLVVNWTDADGSHTETITKLEAYSLECNLSFKSFGLLICVEDKIQNKILRYKYDVIIVIEKNKLIIHQRDTVEPKNPIILDIKGLPYVITLPQEASRE